MAKPDTQQLSVVVPVYNEQAGLTAFHRSLIAVLDTVVPNDYEVLYCDDGSTDATAQLVAKWHAHDPRVKLIKLSRNFGKENALTAGIANASGQAVLMLDGDGQHPVELIADFVQAWRAGAKVIVGVRNESAGESWFKRLASRSFYRLFNRLAQQKLIPGSTDFRLIDRSVQRAFLSLPESNRLTRGLIDWLGFSPQYIHFTPKPRTGGQPGYSYRMLTRLAANSVVSLSPAPLYMFGYLGIFITMCALLLGSTVIVEQLLLGDPWHWHFTGTAMLGILLVFLVGIVLLSQGLLSIYVSHIHTQSKRRPLYVIDYSSSAGIREQL